MSVTLANIHVLGADERQVRGLSPNTTVGRWSDRFISVYSEDFTPDYAQESARTLSMKLPQIVLCSWLSTSDDVGFSLYKNGDIVTEHIKIGTADGFDKMGDIPLFRKSLGLPAEDEKRLRFVWKKGGAEDQLHLTAKLLGLPLYNDIEWLPDKPCARDSDSVDKWIAERPSLKKIISETKATVVHVGEYIDPGFGEFNVSKLKDGGILHFESHNEGVTLTRDSEDGAEIWSRDIKLEHRNYRLFGISDTDIIMDCRDYLRINIETGDIRGIIQPRFWDTYKQKYNNGFWWVSTNAFLGLNSKSGRGENKLLKCDDNLQIIQETSLPSNAQDLSFSPDGKYIYVSIYKDCVIVVNTETLDVVNIMYDKDCLIPRGFDGNGRFWFQRENSFAEAWDILLTKPLSRHRLKGHIMEWRKDENGVMYAETAYINDVYQNISVIYKFE